VNSFDLGFEYDPASTLQFRRQHLARCGRHRFFRRRLADPTSPRWRLQPVAFRLKPADQLVGFLVGKPTRPLALGQSEWTASLAKVVEAGGGEQIQQSINLATACRWAQWSSQSHV